MNEDIKKCIDARVNFLNEYYTVPTEIKGEVSSFITDINNIGENCKDVATFEEKFISTGLSEIFNNILPKCTPKKVKMTKEQKLESIKIGTEIINDHKKEIIKDAVKNAGEHTLNDIKDEEITKNRERMIKDDTFDDYTRARNKLDAGNMLFNYFKNKFKKK